MTHPSEEQLVLHYYGEDPADPETARHLERCSECRELYNGLLRTFNLVDALPVPDPGPDYGERVWRRIEAQVGHSRLPLGSELAPRSPSASGRESRWPALLPWRWAPLGAALAGVVALALTIAHMGPQPAAPARSHAEDLGAREGILLTAVGNYLDRSEMALVELANADPVNGMDISADRERASGLAFEARLYRQTANHTGDAAVAGLMDELERVMVDISHEPSQLSPGGAAKLTERLKNTQVLFKIRVLGSNLRREEAPEPAAPIAE
jgi:hypothetical protein